MATTATNKSKKFKKVRLHKVAKELNLTIDTIVNYLTEQGHASALKGNGVNAAITDQDVHLDLLDYFAEDREMRARVEELRAIREAELAASSGDSAPSSAQKTVPTVTQPKQDEPEPESAVEDTPADEFEPTPVEKSEAIVPQEEEVQEESTAPEDVTETVVVEKPDIEETTSDVEEEPIPEEETVDTQEEEPVVPEEPEVQEETVHVQEEVSETTVVEESVVLPEAPEEAVDVQPEEETKPEVGEEKTLEVTETVDITEAPAEVTDPERTESLEDKEEPDALIAADRYKLQGTKILGKIDLAQVKETKPPRPKRKKRKRKKPVTPVPGPSPGATTKKTTDKPTSSKPKKRKRKSKVDSAEVGQSVQDTLRSLEQGTARVRQRRRRARRQERAEKRLNVQIEEEQREREIRVTEFVSTGELADLMGVPVTEIISMLLSSGMMVSINQRLDADTIAYVADEFDCKVEFITEFGVDDIEEIEDDPGDLSPRAPVVTVMGHVDHGKTSLLDYIRNASVVAGESGGITQHIGAYRVELDDDRMVTFLDTPGHEAFTAMRARGAKVTDVVILVVAANDSVMPQTIEAINHAKAAGVALIVAINKIDLEQVDLQRVMKELADYGVLVEQYGGKIQCAFVSAKTGEGIEDLLEKVLLEADLLELKGNIERSAQGIVIESRLDRGRGNVATVLVQNGTLRVGDPFVAGIYGGRVRAMFDERDNRIKTAGPSEPALVLGLPGQPMVGDRLAGVEDESEARDIAQRRQQIWREQKMRQYKHVRLEDIGRRMALGDFSELNLIIKADVGGSVEAISDSLHKLSTDEVAVSIIHAGVGAITESDVMLASASDAVIIGFQVRPTSGARTAAEREEIDIHTYSIIYDAIEDIRDALEGLLTPEETEKITGVADVRDIFKVPKVGTVAGCYISEGRIRRSDTVHVLREGVVIYKGRLSSLRRFKDDVREVVSGYECGIGVENYNDIKVGDQIEAFEMVQTKRTLDL
ncbi:MAG: translation initiation factor IF-2 [Bacteroidetes bacterium]|nr:translation initiation factor IF-2 [Bacteroidota bacterium]